MAVMRFRLAQVFLLECWRAELSRTRVASPIRGFAALATLIILFSAALPNALAQAATGNEESPAGVVLIKLSPPLYPPLARQARTVGDVKVQLSIRPDGSVESASPVSGDEVLIPAALESALQSRFECRGCSKTNAYSMRYTFQVLVRRA